MKNVIISGFYYDFLVEPICNLERDKYINICTWLDRNDNTPVTHKNKLWWWDIVFGSTDLSKSTSLNDLELQYVLPKLSLFEQQLAREKIFELCTPYEMTNHIFKFIYFFKNMIERDHVDVILFQDIPHGPYDFILYHMAKMLNVRTCFCMPSFWVGETFIYQDLEDIGKYELNSNKKEIVEKKFEKELPYMRKDTFSDTLKKKGKIFVSFRTTVREKIETFNRNKKLYGSIQKYVLLHLQRGIKRYIEKSDYKKNYKECFVDKIFDNEKFVYFPLHLQPEMTTDTLGGCYYDQLLAVEKLRVVLPDDWKIYVKENPKQTYYMRGQKFFERLCQIKNIRLLNKDVNTYELMKRCQFVATITGTAGWECITGGKQVLVFGLAWYRYLSGVSIYYDGITVEEILSKSIDHEKLSKEVAALKGSAYSFVCDEYARENFVDYKYDVNSRNIYHALLENV